MRTGQAQTVLCDVRAAVPDDRREDVVRRLAETPWAGLQHAYGPATDVPALLFAVVLSTEVVRREAWWELWGNVHHQGTVYEVTPACVPFFAEIAADPEHPERVNAIAFLRAIALGNGTHAKAARSAVDDQMTSLLASWDTEPELIRRALAFLASAFPERLVTLPSATELVPPDHRTAWDELVEAGGDPVRLFDDDQDPDDDGDWSVQDRQNDLEEWALAGWHEPGGPARSS